MPMDWETAIAEAVADVMEEVEDWSLEGLERLADALDNYITSIKADEE